MVLGVGHPGNALLFQERCYFSCYIWSCNNCNVQVVRGTSYFSKERITFCWRRYDVNTKEFKTSG